MKDKEERNKTKRKKKEMQECGDNKCPFHGSLKTRGRTFTGRVIKKNERDRRVTIEFEGLRFFRKYDRYARIKEKKHAHLPPCIKVNIGDLIKIVECRPLSKIIHFVVVEVIERAKEEQVIEILKEQQAKEEKYKERKHKEDEEEKEKGMEEEK